MPHRYTVSRAMIVLCTDFGEGPYMGQMEAAILALDPRCPIVRLFSDLPPFNARAAAYLLAAYPPDFPSGSIFLCIIDPGVGSDRAAVAINADGYWFVGPDNGLFNVLCKRAERLERWSIDYVPTKLSASFHGRDIFAPVAAQIARGERVPGQPITAIETPWLSWPDELWQIVYLDRFGNAITGMRASSIAATARLTVGAHIFEPRRVFSEAEPGLPFWYEN